MQARIVVAPDPIAVPDMTHSYFLAGAIDMGAAVDWQKLAIEYFSELRCVLFNPRRATPFTPDMLDEQVEWELDAMKVVDTVLMWFPKDSKAPVAMLETGFLLPTGKLVLGAEEGYYRRRNLELTAQRFNVVCHATLSETLYAARDRMIVGSIV